MANPDMTKASPWCWCRLHLGKTLRTGPGTSTDLFRDLDCRWMWWWTMFCALASLGTGLHRCRGQSFSCPAGCQWSLPRPVGPCWWTVSRSIKMTMKKLLPVSGNCTVLLIRTMQCTPCIPQGLVQSCHSCTMEMKAEDAWRELCWSRVSFLLFQFQATRFFHTFCAQCFLVNAMQLETMESRLWKHSMLQWQEIWMSFSNMAGKC